MQLERPVATRWGWHLRAIPGSPLLEYHQMPVVMSWREDHRVDRWPTLGQDLAMVVHRARAGIRCTLARCSRWAAKEAQTDVRATVAVRVAKARARSNTSTRRMLETLRICPQTCHNYLRRHTSCHLQLLNSRARGSLAALVSLRQCHLCLCSSHHRPALANHNDGHQRTPSHFPLSLTPRLHCKRI